MSTNNHLISGDQVKLLTTHQWSQQGNPTNVRGVVERSGTNISVHWLHGERGASNSYRTSGNDLLLLPITLEPMDSDTIARYGAYCDEMGIELQVTPFGSSQITLTPMHPEQQV